MGQVQRVKYELSFPWKKHHPPLSTTLSFAQSDSSVYSRSYNKTCSSSLNTTLSLLTSCIELSLRLSLSLHHQSVTEFTTYPTMVWYSRTSPLLSSMLLMMPLPDQPDHFSTNLFTQDLSLVNCKISQKKYFANYSHGHVERCGMATLAE